MAPPRPGCAGRSGGRGGTAGPGSGPRGTGARARAWCRRGSGPSGASRQRLEQFDQGQLGLASAEVAVAAQQFPGEHVGDGDQLGQPAGPPGASKTGQGRGEHPLAPGRVVGASAVGQRSQGRRAVLLGQQAQHRQAELLVVVEQVAYRPLDVADGRLSPLPADALGFPLGGRSEQVVFASEAADDGLQGDTGAACHLLQRDVVHWSLPEHGHGGVEDPLAGGRGCLGPGLHPVGALGRRLAHFHVNQLTRKGERRQEAELCGPRLASGHHGSILHRRRRPKELPARAWFGRFCWLWRSGRSRWRRLAGRLRAMRPSSDPSDAQLDAATWCRHLVPAGSVYAFLADHRHQLFPPELFADLARQGGGHPSVPAEVIATVMVLQALEGLSDREAVSALRRDIAWKVACGLRLDDEGFHPTVLVYWRNRIRASSRPRRIFEAVRQVVQATGVLGGRGRRVLDSTVLDDAVATQDTVTQLVAAIRRVRRLVGQARAVELTAHDDDRPGKPNCAWDDPQATQALVSGLVNDALAVLDAVADVELGG